MSNVAPDLPVHGVDPLRRWRRAKRAAWICGLLTLILFLFLSRPGWHLWRTDKGDIDQLEALPPGHTDDASRMNLTAVQEVLQLPADAAEAELQIAKLLAQAREKGWKVSIAGARHSMGGHTMYPGGIVLDTLPLNHIKLDEASNVLHVGSGAIWRDVLKYLDAHGRSVAVMQSNNSFSIGGSISVNCHGWQTGRPPISATVRGLRLMLADGTVLRCDRREHAELFSAVLGGYGLFGLILDVELDVVPNRRYLLEKQVVPTEQLPDSWREATNRRAGAEMVYGRLNVMGDRFLKDAILYVLFNDPEPNRPIPAMHDAGMVSLRRNVFRGSAESEYGKRLRWQAELDWQRVLGGKVFSRNQLLNEGIEVFQNRSAESTDILHEYFVPQAAFSDFIDQLRTIVPRHKGNLLNVTVRSIETDADTLLRYADQPMLSLVMLFYQPRTQEGEERMASMTRELIEASLALGGRYYLPYRLHATTDQFRRAYPQFNEFFTLKRKYDPQEVFQNQFYVKYARPRAE